jgi:hypothetical protein
MTKKQEQVLHRLVRLAQGDPLLVERALRATADEDKISNLGDVVTYITKHAPVHKKRA